MKRLRYLQETCPLWIVKKEYLKDHWFDIAMFFFFMGILCGIILQQEVPTIPKLKPFILKAFDKISQSSDDGNESSSENSSSKRD